MNTETQGENQGENYGDTALLGGIRGTQLYTWRFGMSWYYERKV